MIYTLGEILIWAILFGLLGLGFGWLLARRAASTGSP